MDFSEIEKNIYKISSFLDGDETEVPTFDFSAELKKIKRELVVKSNLRIENYHRFHKLLGCIYLINRHATFNKDIKPNFDVIDKTKFEHFFWGLSDLTSKELPEYERFIFKKFPELNYNLNTKSLLRNIDDFLNDKIPSKDTENVTPKLVWKGTPGEFGAILDQLIDKGYLTLIRNLKYTVGIFSKTFEIRNDTGKIVDHGYLYKCFGEKKKKYGPHDFKLIESDNFSH